MKTSYFFTVSQFSFIKNKMFYFDLLRRHPLYVKYHGQNSVSLAACPRLAMWRRCRPSVWEWTSRVVPTQAGQLAFALMRKTARIRENCNWSDFGSWGRRAEAMFLTNLSGASDGAGRPGLLLHSEKRLPGITLIGRSTPQNY